MAEQQLYSNISKIFDSEGIPVIPSACTPKAIEIVNSKGESKDIVHLVTNFTIIEELFSPALTCVISIRDNENFFSDHGLNGQELIKILIEFYDFNGQPKAELAFEFHSIEYPNFKKSPSELSLNEYTITAISKFAYVSELTDVSYGFPVEGDAKRDGDPLNEIKYIFEHYLKFNVAENVSFVTDTFEAMQIKIKQAQNLIKGQSAGLVSEGVVGAIKAGGGAIANNLLEKVSTALSAAQSFFTGSPDNFLLIDSDSKNNQQVKLFGNITLRSPLQAVEFFRKKTITLNNEPFFVYNSIGQGVGGITRGDTVIVRSLESMVNANPIKTFNYQLGMPFDQGDLALLAQKVISLSSNIRLNKLNMAKRGSYGNMLELYNYAAPEFDVRVYDPYEDGTVLKQFAPEAVKPFGQLENHLGSLSDLIIDQSKTERHLPQSQGNKGDISKHLTAPEFYALYLNKLLYYDTTLLNNNIHQIEIYGDYSINPGTKIELNVPKAYADNVPETDTDLSGEYLVLVNKHVFTKGVYTSQVELAKLKK